MKIVQYIYRHAFGENKRLGILLNENTVLDPNLTFALHFEKEGFFNAEERADYICPSSLHTLLRKTGNARETLELANALYNKFSSLGDLKLKNKTSITVKLGENVRLTKPLDKIETYRDFFVHEKHVATGFKRRNEPIPEAWFEMPVYYKGPTAGFIGTNEEILWPSYTDVLDYELELGMIIGRDGKNIKEKDAHKHIFGFTILNDVSARDIQKKEMTVRLGPSKAKDFCSVIGPVIITPDELGSFEPNLLMTAKVNGSEWSRGQSGDARFSWAQMIEFASRDEWLLASDFCGSGTVGTGCGLELDRWIKQGDTVELEIEKIGKIINKVGLKQDGKL